MDLIIGITLLVAFFGILLYSMMIGDISNVRTIIQLIISGIGSIVVLSPFLLKFVKTFSDKKEDSSKPIDKPEKEEEKDMNNDFEFDCDKDSIEDFKALHYLKERAIELGSKEALDLVVKLNTILFAVECVEEEGEKQDENKV